MARVRRKKKAGEQALPANSNKRPRPAIDLALRQQDEHIDSDDEEDSHDDFKQQQEPSLYEEESEEEEAVDVKRVRLARQYLDTIDARPEDEEESSSDESAHDEQASDDEDDRIGRKLQRDRLKHEGILERVLANKVRRRVAEIQESIAHERPAFLPPPEAAKEWVRQGHVHLLRGHDLTPTSVALQDQCILSGSKDHSVILWDAQTQSRLRVLNRVYNKKRNTTKHDNNNHQSAVSRTDGQVLAVALSDDGRFAVVGKRNGKVEVYDARSAAKHGGDNQNHHLKTLEGHKGAVTCVAFRTQSNQLFSGSDDRCIRHYNLDEMLYMETLYGHQFGVTAIDCHRKERPISAGRDRTARAWKLAEDTHLIFRGGSKIQSAECIALIKDDWFLTGHESGHLNLWFVEKKRAVASIENAHGQGHAIVSIGCCRGSDVAATGSNDGFLRFWKVKTGLTMEERGLEPLCQIPVFGYINAIEFETKSKFCVLAVGQEHRCGRWDRVKGAKNRIAIVNLRSSSVDDNDSDGESSAEAKNDPNMKKGKVADTESVCSDEEDSSSGTD